MSQFLCANTPKDTPAHILYPATQSMSPRINPKAPSTPFEIIQFLITLIMFFNFFKRQWFSLIIIAILLFMQIEGDKRVAMYEDQLIELRKEIELYKVKDKDLLKKIDSLSSLDKEIIERIKIIKQKEYVQVKMVDSIPVSELQQFFTDRYSSSNSN